MNIFNAEVIPVVLAFSVLAWGMVNALVVPLFEKKGWDRFYIMYIAWVVSGVLVGLTGANVFSTTFLVPAAGQVLTALIAGILSNLIADATDKPATVTVTTQHQPPITTVVVSEADPEAPQQLP
jgi:uncharacterized membrane protein